MVDLTKTNIESVNLNGSKRESKKEIKTKGKVDIIYRI